MIEVKRPTTNDPIGNDVVIGEVSKKSMKADHIFDAVDKRMEGGGSHAILDERVPSQKTR